MLFNFDWLKIPDDENGIEDFTQLKKITIKYEWNIRELERNTNYLLVVNVHKFLAFSHLDSNNLKQVHSL